MPLSLTFFLGYFLSVIGAVVITKKCCVGVIYIISSVYYYLLQLITYLDFAAKRSA